MSNRDRNGTSSGERRREVLEAALALMAQHGYAGASLRKLADQLGMQQPSLYHYFSSKEQLVEQIIETFSSDPFRIDPSELPERLQDFPRFMAEHTLRLYDSDPNHALFARVVFTISRTKPQFGKLLRELFIDRALAAMHTALKPYVDRGEIDEGQGVLLLRMVTNAIAFRLMEEKVLFDERELGPEVRDYIEFVVATAELKLGQLRAARGFED